MISIFVQYCKGTDIAGNLADPALTKAFVWKKNNDELLYFF